MFACGEVAADAASVDCQQAFAEHNEWLRLQRESYAESYEVACPLSMVDTHILSSEDAMLAEDMIGYPVLTSGFGSLLLEDDAFDEGPVYRSLTLVQPSGGYAQLHDPTPSYQHPADVDSFWLQGANPPLVRRQKGLVGIDQ